MDDSNAQDGKQMFDVNEKCTQCGASITKLPFKPNPDWKSNLKCLDCFKKQA